MASNLADGEFGDRFTNFQYTAYRLETLQRYTVPQEAESLAAFLAGHPDPFGSYGNSWARTVAGAAAAGKVIQRVHVIEEPVTDYLRYELTVYGRHAAAGEDIRVIPVRAGQWPGEIPRRDYWLFDSSDLWLTEYDDQGRFLGSAHVTDAEDTILHAYWREAALHVAVPYADYVRRP